MSVGSISTTQPVANAQASASSGQMSRASRGHHRHKTESDQSVPTAPTTQSAAQTQTGSAKAVNKIV